MLDTLHRGIFISSNISILHILIFSLDFLFIKFVFLQRNLTIFFLFFLLFIFRSHVLNIVSFLGTACSRFGGRVFNGIDYRLVILNGAVGLEDKVTVIISLHHSIDFSIKRLWWRIFDIFSVRIIPTINGLFVLPGRWYHLMLNLVTLGLSARIFLMTLSISTLVIFSLLSNFSSYNRRSSDPSGYSLF